MSRLLLSIALVLSTAAQTALADGDGDRNLIDLGLEAYAQAQSLTDRDARLAAFARAEQLFMQAAGNGNANAALYANAGTAALQAERLGPAILAFQRALVIDPDHATTRRNLTHARTLLPAWVPRPSGESVFDTFFFWHRALSTAERAGAGAACFLLAALTFSVAIRWRSRLARSFAWLPSLAWVALTVSLVVDARGDPTVEAVITAEEAVARASDSSNAPARFADPLPGGTEVEVVQTRDRWTRIRLANDREAWVNRRSLEMVLEPDARSRDEK